MKADTAVRERIALAKLPYAYDALAPEISEETLRYHHDKHLAGYVEKTLELSAGTPYEGQPLGELLLHAEGPLLNNAAQAWNHTFYFEQFTAEPSSLSGGALREAIVRDFGSADTLRTRMLAACSELFGSGWVWLVADNDGKVSIFSGQNAANPLREASGLQPLLTLDVWEHAYYIDYRNRRADAVAAHWRRIDWRCVAERYDRTRSRK